MGSPPSDEEDVESPSLLCSAYGRMKIGRIKYVVVKEMGSQIWAWDDRTKKSSKREEAGLVANPTVGLWLF